MTIGTSTFTGTSKHYNLYHTGKIQQVTVWFLLFFPENKLWYFLQIVSVETICKKYQSLFSGKKKNQKKKNQNIKKLTAEKFTQDAKDV